MSEERALSVRSAEVLRLISQGRTYEQILSIHPEVSYLDIFRAAAEALEVTGQMSVERPERVARTREMRPRAHELWSPSEDAEITRLVALGESAEEIARSLRRQPGAVRSRMMKLNLSENDITG